MGSNAAMRQFLRSLCDFSQWEYAVFWKLDRMLLTWEDGYCGYPKPGEFIEKKSDNGCITESSLEYPIGQAVASMSHLVYSFGEGRAVGKVASTGKPRWDSLDDFNSMVLPEYANEWLNQFAVGIKTILLVPVVPHGVVQLGSLAMVSEDSELVGYVKDTFNILQHVSAASLSFTCISDLLASATSSTMTVSMQNLTESSYCTSYMVNTFQSELLSKTDDVTINDTTSHFMDEDNPHVLDSLSSLEFDALSVATAMLSYPENQFSDPSHFRMMGGNVSDLPYLGEDMIHSSDCGLTELMSMNFRSLDDLIDQTYKETTSKEIEHESVCHSLNFPLNSELHEALGPALQKRCKDSCSDVCSSSNLIRHAEFTGDINPSVNVSSPRLKRRGGEHHTVVSNVSNSIGSPTASERNFAASCQTQSQSGENSSRWSYIRSDSISRNEVLPNSPLEPLPKTKLINENQKKKVGYKQSRKGGKLSNTDRRKSKLGDAQKPRPRDRQMIQDRVKELRQLVPSGAKCSIDALLDQTVKHMLFLRSVTDQAEKLEQCINQKVSVKKNIKSCQTPDRQNGSSWAVEVGSQFGLCPIVVKDLDHQGHMLIEMICEKHSLFLEIAQVIRNSKLTILKGVMEDRSDEMWAHFIVENRDQIQFRGSLDKLLKWYQWIAKYPTLKRLVDDMGFEEFLSIKAGNSDNRLIHALVEW
ncbi:hypothetical protein GIB67_007804 [Kingdonia uniflora]|uniref:BHLH domain-containing protein n=1 Tax=Kingdonia uniflora TaxID=39325 RepID=A0A7J7N1Z7_9MAGN|nr:hypothetical protein GIB67_007804 [Kingdonia uniflora]